MNVFLLNLIFNYFCDVICFLKYLPGFEFMKIKIICICKIECQLIGKNSKILSLQIFCAIVVKDNLVIFTCCLFFIKFFLKVSSAKI